MRVLSLFLLPLWLYALPLYHIQIQSPISPASATFLEKALAAAQEAKAQALVIELDTPGGLLESTRDMVQAITASPLPVVVFVSPTGARAASAGTYLLYASHLAAMAPGTNVGAATPVSLSMESKEQSTMEKKAIADAGASLKSLAELRGRNSAWAVKAVEEGVSISAAEALELGVIELLVPDLASLREALEGRAFLIGETTHTLRLENAPLVRFEPDFKIRLLTFLANPTLAYGLLLLAVYGIFFELVNPGALFPGIVGVISGVMAMYALHILPFDYAGLALIGLGIALMVAEVLVAGFGLLGIAGIIAFVLGSLLLFDAQTLGQGISIPLIIALAITSAGFFAYVLQSVFLARRMRAVSGVENLLGAHATVVKKTKDGYLVSLQGELWAARAQEVLLAEQEVEITAIDGLILHVKPLLRSQL